MTRRQWDQDLSELVGGSSDPDAPAIANRIERAVRERALEAVLRDLLHLTKPDYADMTGHGHRVCAVYKRAHALLREDDE